MWAGSQKLQQTSQLTVSPKLRRDPGCGADTAGPPSGSAGVCAAAEGAEPPLCGPCPSPLPALLPAESGLVNALSPASEPKGGLQLPQ